MSKQLEYLLNNYAYSSQQKHQLKLADSKGLDLNYIKNPKLDWEQMREIRLCQEYSIDPSPICDPDIPSESMEKIRIHLFEKAGIYKAENEKIQKKKMKRYFVMFLFLCVIVISGISIYSKRDYLLLYVENLVLELNSEEIEIGLSKVKKIDYMAYIKQFNKKYKLELPDEMITEVGNYTVTYKISNEVKSKEAYLLIHVYDDVAPVINLSLKSVTVKENQTFNPDKYIISVTDNIDGDLSDKIAIESNVKNEPGKYEVKYSVSDSNNNKTEEVLKVTIKEMEVTSSSNNNSQSPSNNNNKSKNEKNNSAVLKSKIFYFSKIGDADEVYQKAEKYAEVVRKQGKVSGYKISPYSDGTKYIGYKVVFY